MVGADYSTKLAPWLALGCISARRVASEVGRYEKERMPNTPREERHNGRPNGNKSTYWVLFELLWRDFFRFSSLKIGDDLFHLAGPVPRDFTGNGKQLPPGAMSTAKRRKFAESDAAKWWRDPLRDPAAAEALLAWKEGRTGAPLVDANMRELAVSPSVRPSVSSSVSSSISSFALVPPSDVPADHVGFKDLRLRSPCLSLQQRLFSCLFVRRIFLFFSSFFL